MSRTAVVTGASSGIGAATAVLLAEQGWNVIGAARRVDLIEQLPGVQAVALDVTSAESVAALAAAVASCDLLVANAGGAFDVAPLAKADVETWARTYDVNVLGLVRTVQALLPALRAAKGHVIMTGSTAGRWVYEGGGGYVAAKHAVNGLTKSVAKEYGTQGITVNAICPASSSLKSSSAPAPPAPPAWASPSRA